MARKWIVLPVLVFGLIACTVGAYAAWSASSLAVLMPDPDEDGSSLSLPAMEASFRASARGRSAANAWLADEVAYAARANDLPRLMTLSVGADGPFRSNEEAALVTCRGLLLGGPAVPLEHVRELWRGRETRRAAWLALDADVLLAAGRTEEARKLLAARGFPGAEDAGRLARLALTEDEPADAYGVLARAADLAPGDPDVRDCRGRLLEAEGRPAEAAGEFAAALAARGEDWVLRDRLAECYRRAGDFDAARATWLPPGSVPQADFAWLRAWFWDRVARPAPRDWEAAAPVQGPMRVVADYALRTPAGRFAPEDGEVRLLSRGLHAQWQETDWLNLLALLQDGHEAAAARALRHSPFRRASWQPELVAALDRVLAFRAGARVREEPAAAGPVRHPFFAQLECLAAEGKLSPGAAGLPEDVRRLLAGDEAFAAACLAAGWDEAALLLHHPDADLSTLPGWYADGLARAVWANRGAGEALAFVRGQTRAKTLDLVAGELLLAAGRRTEAIERLRAAEDRADVGPRAAWLLVETALREGRPAEARRVLEAHPRLTADAEGQLLSARCAAAEGKDDLALRLYREAAGDSAEAGAYLVRRALAGGDWAAAGRLADGLLAGAGR